MVMLPAYLVERVLLSLPAQSLFGPLYDPNLNPPVSLQLCDNLVLTIFSSQFSTASGFHSAPIRLTHLYATNDTSAPEGIHVNR